MSTDLTRKRVSTTEVAWVRSTLIGIALVFLLASFSLLLLINLLTWRRSRRLSGHEEW